MSAAPLPPVPYLAEPKMLEDRVPCAPVRPPPLPHDVRARKDRDGKFGAIVPDLTEATYGDYRVVRRVDGLFAVIDLLARLGAECPVYEHEIDARAHAARAAARGVADSGRRM